jgi:hypothetical protein
MSVLHTARLMLFRPKTFPAVVPAHLGHQRIVERDVTDAMILLPHVMPG